MTALGWATLTFLVLVGIQESKYNGWDGGQKLSMHECEEKDKIRKRRSRSRRRRGRCWGWSRQMQVCIDCKGAAQLLSQEATAHYVPEMPLDISRQTFIHPGTSRHLVRLLPVTM